MLKTMVGGVVLSVVALVGRADAKPSATMAPAADLKWNDVPGMAGVHLATAEGDPTKGASHFFLKLDKGFAAPEHHHSPDHSGFVVSGTLILTVDGKESKLPAGSYFAFSGKKVHATRCDAAADCVLAMDARGKWDVVPDAKPADAKPADAKKPAK